jgi:hypothetical protein
MIRKKGLFILMKQVIFFTVIRGVVMTVLYSKDADGLIVIKLKVSSRLQRFCNGMLPQPDPTHHPRELICIR